jgi:hypothetical protein
MKEDRNNLLQAKRRYKGRCREEDAKGEREEIHKHSEKETEHQ